MDNYSIESSDDDSRDANITSSLRTFQTFQYMKHDELDDDFYGGLEDITTRSTAEVTTYTGKLLQRLEEK